MSDRYNSFLRKLKPNSILSNIPILEEAKEKESSNVLNLLKRQNTLGKSHIPISDTDSASFLNESDERTPVLHAPLLKDSCERLKNLRITQFSPIEISSGRKYKDEPTGTTTGLEQSNKNILSLSPKVPVGLKISDSNITEIARRAYSKAKNSSKVINKDL